MSYTESNLFSTGFDYVVAVTQDSINGALKETLYAGQPEVILCYAYDNSNPPALVPIDHAALVTAAQGADPFAVPAGTAGTDPRVQNLNNAGFAFAVKAQLGLPPGVPPADLPPIIALKPGQSNVTYTVTFAELAVAEIVYGPRGSVTWFSDSQPSGTGWTFSGTVDLDFQDASFTALSQAAQARLKGLGPDPAIFTIQQLYYDLNNSNLIQGFQFDGMPATSLLGGFMADNFIGTYFKNLNGAELLGYAAKQATGVTPGSLWVTDVNFFTPNAVGATGAPLTLNYLCAAGGDALPDTTHAGFGWNWIEAKEEFDGVAALNRMTLGKYLRSAALPGGGTLDSYVSSNCYQPSVSCTLNQLSQVQYGFSAAPGGAPTAAVLPGGPVLITYSYLADASDQAGAGGDLGQIEIAPSFNLTVSIAGNQIMIDQRLAFSLRLKHLATQVSGNVVDKTLVDTYSVGVDENGQLAVALANSTTTDNSQQLDVSGFLDFFTNVNEYASEVTQWAESLASGHFKDLPLSLIGNFVFPGSAAFTFSGASFSAAGDLVSHITYVSTL
jgi:hypothetical protein